MWPAGRQARSVPSWRAGAGISPTHRRLFNPTATDAFVRPAWLWPVPAYGEMAQNSTQDLIADIEALRIELGIDSWLLFGGSWGSTLALAYAIAHPERVTGLILRGIFLGTRAEVDWFLYDMGRFFPEAHAEFMNFLTAEERKDVLLSYHEKLTDPQPLVHQPAAERWASYETSCSTLRAGVRRVSGRSALSMSWLKRIISSMTAFRRRITSCPILASSDICQPTSFRAGMM